MKAKVGDRIRLNARSGEVGTIVGVRERGVLPSIYVVKWDDEKLGIGNLFEWEFEVIDD